MKNALEKSAVWRPGMNIPDQKHWPRDRVGNVDRSARDTARCAPSMRRGPHAKHRRVRSGWKSLTRTEIKVATFVEEGLSNREIAARLQLSRRTVATHVSHILKKLDVHSRTDIAEIVHEAALVRETARQVALRTIADAVDVRQRRTRRVARSAVGLLAAAVRLLPAADRARYADEYLSELWELAQSGDGRIRQVRYALRQLRRVPSMGFALRSLRRRSAEP
jgi:DNA-binding CsgD family transcriptional regulator